MKSGYQSLEFALKKNRDPDFKKQDVEEAREFLQDCINLSDELTTENLPNAEVMGTAHFGLAIVYNLKGDSEKASHHLFNAYRYTPRKARELTPEIYSQFFKSPCGPVIMTLNKEQALEIVESGVLTRGFTEEELIKAATEIGKVALRAAAVGAGVGAFILTLGRVPPHIFISTTLAANNEIDKITPDRAIQVRERAAIEKKAEELRVSVEADAQRQDNCCKQKAIEYLKNL